MLYKFKYKGKVRNVFRHNRTSLNILNNDGFPDDNNYDLDECGEECGVISLDEFALKEKSVKSIN